MKKKKRAFFEKKIDKKYFDSIAYSSKMLKKEEIKEKVHTPIPVIPSLTENEGTACIISEIFKQKKCIIDFSNFDMTNPMISEFKNDMFGMGLKDDYHYSLKLGMDYSKMEATMGEKEVIDQVRYRLSKALSLPISMFTNISLHRGSLEVKFSIKDRNNKNVDPLSKYNMISLREEFPQLIQVEILADLGSKDQVEEYLSPEHNMDYTKPDIIKEDKRGGMTYYLPKGWVGKALNVSKYGDGKWLTMDNSPGEWAVGFHGTRKQYINPILEEGLKPRWRQAYEYDIDTNSRSLGKGRPCGKGVYFSPQIDVAAGYAEPFAIPSGAGFINIRVAFQCRLNPVNIRIPKKEIEKEKVYYIVNNTQDIRPYRIMIKQE